MSSIFEHNKDVRNFSSWQHQKQSNSARRPSKMESWVQSWRLRTPSISFCVKCCACCEKKCCQVIRCAAPVTQNHLCKTEDLMLQNGTCLRKWAPGGPDLLTSLTNMSLVLRLPRKMHLRRSSSYAPRLPTLLKLLQNRHLLLIFDKVHNPLRLPHETTSERPKVVRTCGAFNILTWKSASRHSSVHFFDISTSTNAPTLKCSVHFDLEICFAPQLRALFRQLPSVLRTWGVFSFFTCKCASRHNSVQFFISHLARLLRTRRFSEHTFGPSAATNQWKTQWITTFVPFRAPASSFFWLFLFSDLLSSALLLSDSSHLCFSICPCWLLNYSTSCKDTVHVFGVVTSLEWGLVGGCPKMTLLPTRTHIWIPTCKKKHGRNMSMCAMVKTCVGFPCWQKCMYCTIHMRP